MTQTGPAGAQRRAADPANSTWLLANAGSGKTSVLIDRVVRLLLGGTRPQRILCLTYTKAAASEMQNRLFSRLGGWSMLPDDALRKALDDLQPEARNARRGPEGLAAARRLFAQAVETPGGLKIQTIHSFCAGLLRRFPMEAGVSPGFRELDDFQTAELRALVAEEMASGGADDLAVLDGLVRRLSDAAFPKVLGEICRNRDAFSKPVSFRELCGSMGIPSGLDAASLVSRVYQGGEAELIDAITPLMAASSAFDVRDGRKLVAARAAGTSLAGIEGLEAVLLFGKAAEAPYSARVGKVPTQPLRKGSLGRYVPALEALMLRVEDARPLRLALASVEDTLALHRFAAAYLPRYAAAKAVHGVLDFDDLIQLTSDLLSDHSVAAWVLWRLDGGIDHILVDEAQDTSPAQWGVIEHLTREIIAGAGADRSRTVFVVGDPKQSIYSFQGADLGEFTAKHRHFRTWLAHPGPGLTEEALLSSFRSAEAILRTVDLTFDLPGQSGLGERPPKHHVHFDRMPGRVDLWPVIPDPEKPETQDWIDPAHFPAEPSADVTLAGRIAQEIRGMIDAGTQIPQKDGSARRMHEGDVLILVRRRKDLFHAIIRACKSVGLNVAGADRMNLGNELAVRDILALLSFLALPEDDLSLATALRSPLFGWSEAMLYQLAQPRAEGTYLWAALRDRQAEFGDTHAVLTDLRDQTDYLRPYDLIERLLIRHDGRRKLLARLGQEAEDAIDELLTQALIYERSEVPSLTGFLGRLAAGEVEVKRQLSSAGDAVRVMTVHGAKGLEAPVVILPETGDWKLEIKDQTLAAEGAVLWRAKADEMPSAIRAAVDAAKAKIADERMRLLYVAMTRAQSWLIVCCAGKAGEGADSWYGLIADGVAKAGGVAVDGPGGTIINRVQLNDWPDDLGAAPGRPETAAAALPGWIAKRPAAAVPRPSVLSPSRLPGAKVLAGPPGMDARGQDDDRAKQMGTALHRLLEHLPLWPEQDWPEIASAVLISGENPVDPADQEPLLQAARRVLTAPGLRDVMGLRAMTEVEVGGPVADLGGAILRGAIDRLVVADDHVLAIDYKSNAVVPETASEVPIGLLRQMGAYAALLAEIYPGRRIDVAILWTAEARLMPLPLDIVRAALQSTTIP